MLFASIPAWGHVYPVLAGLAELVRRGHRVSCLASTSFTREVGAIAGVVPYDSPMDGQAELSDLAAVLPLMLREVRASYAVLERIGRADRPDVIVSDVLAMSGWVLGQVFGIPVIRTWPVFASNAEFSLHRNYGSRPDSPEAMAEFLAGVSAFLADIGLDSMSPRQFFESEAERNIALFPREIQPCGETFDTRFTFIRPCIRPAEQSPELDWLRNAKPLAAISLGTVFNEKIDFFRTCIDSVERLGWHAAAAIGGKIRPPEVGPVSDRVLLRTKLPMIDTLRHASVLVSHGGLTSTIEALANGVPVLIAPQIGEQRAVADSVETLGLGVRLPESFTAAELADLIKTVVDDADVAHRVAEFQAKLRSERSGDEFADAVELAFP
ncbi:nucleotide disphospho-sugar-binding domain-containing protein [Kutzneria sp. CA-103260]|uniref:nucleotide disphospho-sugar-binding domain-containing protein n=1 Tax=Kutzneria sp. CA-103260 TaxID=2802641 RepID=UPI001BA96EE1|nr:nucleotide disphospho-sugar-binding domain-containing protein [Kutzneria sp. CA-103260]